MKRWPLYALVCALAIALQIAIAVLTHAGPRGSLFIVMIVQPLATAVVIVNVGFDACAAAGGWNTRLERIVERAWAIILIDAMITLANEIGVAAMVSGDVAAAVMGTAVLFFLAMLVYAEPFAALDEHVGMLLIVPLALLRSMMLGWVNMRRIFGFFVLLLAASGVDIALQLGLKAARMPRGDYWEMAYATVITVALFALFTVAYFDTLAQERESAL